MSVLICPVGAYAGRVVSGIAKLKPEKIYLLLSKKTDSEYSSAWSSTTKKFADIIVGKIGLFYDSNSIARVELDMGDFDECLNFLLGIASKNSEVLIDITSARRSFEIAATTVGILFSGVSCVYTPPKNPLLPDDYSSKVIEDSGRGTVMISTPKIDFNELKSGILYDIIKTISAAGGKSDTYVEIMRKMGWDESRSNVIRFSKFLNRLEKYGCVQTKRSGRKKSVSLTELGRAVSKL